MNRGTAPAITCLWPVQGAHCGKTAHMTMVGPMLIHFECLAGHTFHTPLDCIGFEPCDCGPVESTDEWWLKVA